MGSKASHSLRGEQLHPVKAPPAPKVAALPKGKLGKKLPPTQMS